MSIRQNGDEVTATHITGPTHNFLRFTVGRRAAAPVFVFDEPVDDWPLPAVKQAILDAIKDAGGTGNMSVSTVRLLGSDTPMIDVYRWMAVVLARHIRTSMQADHSEAAE